MVRWTQEHVQAFSATTSLKVEREDLQGGSHVGSMPIVNTPLPPLPPLPPLLVPCHPFRELAL